MVIGIDLGTTFSVIAVNGKVELTAGYQARPRYLDHCDVSIIPDPFGADIIPSALWENPEQPGEMVVGTLAKEATLDGFSPVLFSKRNIGTNIGHDLNQRQMTARQAAAEILKYLKGIAEDALGERVDRAIITHPAYFDPAMREETGQAAVDAGFDFDPSRHLLMEPIAAALAYTRTDSRDPLRILAYDLGGGTFDVTVMERKKDVITIKAFGGNRLLGGYNFDRELARWIVKQLQERGVRLTLDEENPEHRAKWARLLRVAEDAKIKLARARTNRVPVSIKEQAIFDDDGGRPINLVCEITGQKFTELIQPLLDSTIFGDGSEGETKGCNMVVAEAGFTIDQIDEILLVGGSTAAPWVSETIAKAWGREAQVFEPDLCVAAGAAVYATTLPEEVRGSSCRIEMDTPRHSVLDIISVAGKVTPLGSPDLCANLQVLLTGPAGRRFQAEVSSEGNFLFDGVELQPETVSRFALEAVDTEGRKVVEHQFEIEHASEGGHETTGVLTVLPKPLYVEVLEGMKPLAEEGATLPAQCSVELKRTNMDDTIEVRLFQEAEPIGTVVIENVPREATVGSRVGLSLEISRSNRITGTATVYTRADQPAIESPVDIRIPQMMVPGKDDLTVELRELELERMERIELERDPNARIAMQAKGDRLRDEIETLLADGQSDHQEVWLKLRSLRRVVHPPREDMEPSMDEFERTILRTREILSGRAGDPTIQSHTKIVERLESEGRVAHSKKDRKAWAQINSSLQSLLQRLERPARESREQAEVQETALQKLFAHMQLDQTRQLLRQKEVELAAAGKIERAQREIDCIKTDIEAIGAEIDSIDDTTDGKAAQSKLQLLFFQKVKPLEERIGVLGVDVRM